jgi:hypothetical protein
MGITAGPDGKVWLTEYSGPDVGKMPPCGCGTDYSLNSDYLPKFIVRARRITSRAVGVQTGIAR